MALNIRPVCHTREVEHGKSLNPQNSELSGSLRGEKNIGLEPTIDETQGYGLGARALKGSQ